MSWLSSLIHKVDPIGSKLIGLDPIGKAVIGDPNQSSSAPSQPAMATPQPAQDPSQGNASDPAYGSFTQPFDVQSFYQNLDPSYFFRLQQGQQGLANSAAAGSGALSGSALKDLMNYNQTAASQEYGNAYNRYQTTQGNIFNRLFSIAGLGQASASNVGANNTNLAGNAGQAIQNQGSALGGGIVGAGNALGGALGTWGAYNYMQNPAARVSP